MTDINAFYMFVVFAIPISIGIRYLVVRQSRASRLLTEARNNFSADITDRLNGLFQILVEDKTSYHITKALRSQKAIVNNEIEITIYQSILSLIEIIHRRRIRQSFQSKRRARQRSK